MDTHEKYKKWESAVGNEDLARRLFQAAMNLSEDRSGGLLVVLDDPQVGRQLVAAGGLAADQPPLPAGNSAAKEHLHYLVRARRATELAPTVLESIASIDGAVLLDRTAQVLAFGAILHDPSPCARTSPVEGGRSTAAILASRFGKVLKISEDGPITFYMDESRVWEI